MRAIRYVVASCMFLGMAALVGTAGSTAAVGAPSALQQQIDSQLHRYPGGVQVSDNAVAYNGGDVVIVFPSPGHDLAPNRLGSHVRDQEAHALGLTTNSPDVAESTGYLHGCPYSTLTNADWYCFYTDRDFGGRRLQFKDTDADFAGNWGFDNQTSSWVNTNHTFSIYAYSVSCGNVHLWTEPTGPASSSYVGDTNNDRLSFWSKTFC